MRIIRLLAEGARRIEIFRLFVIHVRYYRDLLIDRYLNINTTERKIASYSPGTFTSSYPYEAVDYVLMYKFIRALNIDRNDTVVDIGCGKGRVLGIVARKPVKKVVGIEISPELCRFAKENSKKLRKRISDIEIICKDASEYDYEECGVFIMFNPFGQETLRNVVDKWKDSLSHNPRKISVLYINATHEKILENSGFLRKEKEIKPLLYKTTASYWTNDF